MPKFLCSFLLLAMFLFLPALAATASKNRVLLASQFDFSAKRGFYLDVENQAPDGTPPRLSTLRLILGVGDGKSWHFLDDVPAWQYGRDWRCCAEYDEAGT